MRPLGFVFAVILFFCAGDASAKGDYSKVREELEALKAPHPWAGVYRGPSAMSPTSLYLAPSGRYCVITFWDGGGNETGYCGRLTLDGDFFREAFWSRLKNGDHYDGPPYIRISWGARKYLVPEKRIYDFINAVNGGEEPRQGHGLFSGGDAFLLSGGGDVLVVGTPELPSRYRSFLLPKPLLTTAIDVSPRTKIVTRYHGYEDEDCGAEARFGAGASSGVFVGMELHAQTSDEQASALVKEVWISSSAGRIKQDFCDKSSPIPVGTAFASRPSWRFRDVLSTEPLTTEIVYSSSKRFPPFSGGVPEDLLLEDAFAGAAAEGFSWEKVAEVTFSGSFSDALELDEVSQQMDRAILSIGGNAVYEIEDKKGLLARQRGVAEARRRRVFRLSFHGKAINPGRGFWLDFAPRGREERNRYDWKRAALSARAIDCGQFRAEAEAIDAAVAEALRGRSWTSLTTKDESLMGPAWKRGWRAKRDYETAHPEEAAACQKLKEEAERRR